MSVGLWKLAEHMFDECGRCVSFEDNKTTCLGHDVHDMAQFLEEHGYSVVVSEWEPIAEYGTRHGWRRVRALPD